MPRRADDKRATTPSSKRRPVGEPRRLLLDAARDLFARRDYRSTTTREIATLAGVSEYLLFRHFGSKAGLFREALVAPFTGFVDDFGATWRAMVPEDDDDDALARHFIGELYDVFVEHQGLLMTLLGSTDVDDEEMSDAGIAEVRRALNVLAAVGADAIQLQGLRAGDGAMPAYSTIAMIAGMVALRATYFGSKTPPRDAIVTELIQATLHGFLHRTD